MKLFSKLLLAFVLSLSLAPIASACPLCADSIPESHDGSPGEFDTGARLGRLQLLDLFDDGDAVRALWHRRVNDLPLDS